MTHRLRCGRHLLDLTRPRVMGVLNVTPDSFSDGGRFLDFDRALAHARVMLADGADIIDIGGESTRPGAPPTAEADEIERVIPIVEALVREDVVVSVDTMKPAVMRVAISAGASMINDVRALQSSQALETVAKHDVAVCLMHMQGEPRTMQSEPVYGDVVADVRRFLEDRVVACKEAGIAAERIAVDPGFGFGKTVAHNLRLLRELPAIASLGLPIIAGLSRKSTLGALTGRSADDRLAASLAASLSAVAHGASIIRVHDVRETVDALKVWWAIEKGNEAT
jgi:dihydropteroate synthase